MDCFPVPVSGFGGPKLFGATDIVPERGAEAGDRVRGLTGGRRALCVVECVGTRSSLDTALAVVRDGGSIAMVGGPHGPVDDISPIFRHNLTLTGGLTPVRDVTPTLVDDVLSGELDPSPVFGMTVDLDGIPAAYLAMSNAPRSRHRSVSDRIGRAHV